jgi:hypothetical protein
MTTNTNQASAAERLAAMSDAIDREETADAVRELVENYYRSKPGTVGDKINEQFASEIRAYSNDLLERAAQLLDPYPDEYRNAPAVVRALKSEV